MRKWTIPSILLLLFLLALIPDQGKLVICCKSLIIFSVCCIVYGLIRCRIFDFSGRNIQAKAEDESDKLVDPPKVEEKLGAVPNGLSTDSDVAKRLVLSIMLALR